MNFESGYYWVLCKEYTHWEVAYYNKPNNEFRLTGDKSYYRPSYFEKINEERILQPKN